MHRRPNREKSERAMHSQPSRTSRRGETLKSASAAFWSERVGFSFANPRQPELGPSGQALRLLRAPRQQAEDIGDRPVQLSVRLLHAGQARMARSLGAAHLRGDGAGDGDPRDDGGPEGPGERGRAAGEEGRRDPRRHAGEGARDKDRGDDHQRRPPQGEGGAAQGQRAQGCHGEPAQPEAGTLRRDHGHEGHVLEGDRRDRGGGEGRARPGKDKLRRDPRLQRRRRYSTSPRWPTTPTAR